MKGERLKAEGISLLIGSTNKRNAYLRPRCANAVPLDVFEERMEEM